MNTPSNAAARGSILVLYGTGQGLLAPPVTVSIAGYAADVLALVSLWEGFGLPVIEAMACGTAVLTSNTSSLAEIAGNAAALADPQSVDDIAAQLERLLLDDVHRATLAARGPAQAATFTWDATARRVISALAKFR